MSLTVDMSTRSFYSYQQMIDYAWLGGAAVGLKVLRLRSPDWKWDPFIADIVDMIEQVSGVEEVAPGAEPAVGSMLDSLGGYVSIVGELQDDGLYFPFPQEKVPQLVAKLGLHVSYANDWITIQKRDLGRFMNLVIVRGPLETQIEEEIFHD